MTKMSNMVLVSVLIMNEVIHVDVLHSKNGFLLCVNSQASQVSNRDQFAVTQVTIEVMKKSRNPPRFDKERYEGFIYSNSVPESMILRDRSTNRPFRVRARDEDFAGVSVSLHSGHRMQIDYVIVVRHHGNSCW